MTLEFVVKTAARLLGRSVVVEVLETAGPENEHRIVASLVADGLPDQEIEQVKALRADLGRFVSSFCLNALQDQPLFALSKRDQGKIFVAEGGKACWVREPETLIARGIAHVPAQYIEFGRARDDVVGDEIISATLSLAMGRQSAVAKRVRLDGRGLEISPGAAPLIRREDAAGGLTYCDKVGGDAWKASYGAKAQGEMLSSDVTLGTRRLDEVFPAAHFDYVVSSHVLEHIPDFIGFFKSVEIVLKPNSDLVMIVPDKRYTFDVLREPTSIAQIERAHELRLIHPSREMMREFFSHIDHAATAELLWAKTHQPAPTFSADQVEERLGRTKPEDIDLHCWVFTPSVMRTLLDYVCEVHAPLLHVVEVSDTPHGSIEFMIHMKKEGPLG
jgi:SAM-dependent methyltransferase